MVEILEQPDIRRIVSPMTVETYHQLAELGPDVQSTELIRGIVVEKVDKMSRSQLHIYLIRRLVRMIQAIAQTSGVFTLRENPLTLADSEPESFRSAHVRSRRRAEPRAL